MPSLRKAGNFDPFVHDLALTGFDELLKPSLMGFAMSGMMVSVIIRPIASRRVHPNVCSACAFHPVMRPCSSILMTELSAVSIINLVRPSLFAQGTFSVETFDRFQGQGD